MMWGILFWIGKREVLRMELYISVIIVFWGKESRIFYFL